MASIELRREPLLTIPQLMQSPRRIARKDSQSWNFTPIKKLGEGSFGVVYSSIGRDGEVVAVKRVKVDPRLKNREFSILRLCHSPNLISLKAHFVAGAPAFEYFVTDFMPLSLSAYISQCHGNGIKIDPPTLKCISFQIFSGLLALHSIGICHRDIKPSNILIDPFTKVVKICDFGSAKIMNGNSTSASYIGSRFYRAPELLLGCDNYGFEIDIWAAGCTIAEMLLDGIPMFQGNSNIQQLRSILQIIGYPSVEDNCSFRHCVNIPKNVEQIASIEIALPLSVDAQLLDLLKRIFSFSPLERPNAGQCLCSSYFSDIQRDKILAERSLPRLL